MEFFAPSSFFCRKIVWRPEREHPDNKKTALEIGAVFEFIALEAD